MKKWQKLLPKYLSIEPFWAWMAHNGHNPRLTSLSVEFTDEEIESFVSFLINDWERYKENRLKKV